MSNIFKAGTIGSMLVLLSCTWANGQPSKALAMAQQVLDQLYSVSGQYIYEKPALEVAKDNYRVAAYYPKKNVIRIDQKALDICASMGGEAPNAFSFVIGHELAHAFQKEVRAQAETTNFLAYDKGYHASLRTEKVADIQGVFTGYLAGYGMKKAIPKVLKSIYSAYQIDDDKLSNYPSFEERSASAEDVTKVVEDLIDLQDVSEYLMALGRYDLGIYCLEYILEYYQGFDIQNNLGVAHLLTAMDFAFDTEIDKYAFPLELDSSSRLKKIDRSRGGAAMSQTERNLRNTILNQGLAYFENAISLNIGYTAAKINKACTLNLLNKPATAFEYLGSRSFSKKEKNEPAYLLVMGITYALLKEKSSAGLQFNSLKNNDHLLIAALAGYNYDVLNGKVEKSLDPQPFKLPNKVASIPREYKVGSKNGWEKIILDSEIGLFCSKVRESGTRSFSFSDGFKDFFSIVISDRDLGKVSLFSSPAELQGKFTPNLVVSKNSFFIRADPEPFIVKCSDSGQLVEVAKYFGE